MKVTFAIFMMESLISARRRIFPGIPADARIGGITFGSWELAVGRYERRERRRPMWSTQTAWFDIAVVMSIFAVGNILFGHFEEHRPKARRLLKVALIVGATAALSAVGLRWVAYSLIGLMLLAAAYVHLWWLPSRGINGWTGEPKEKYYELVGAKPTRHVD